MRKKVQNNYNEYIVHLHTVICNVSLIDSNLSWHCVCTVNCVCIMDKRGFGFENKLIAFIIPCPCAYHSKQCLFVCLFVVCRKDLFANCCQLDNCECHLLWALKILTINSLFNQMQCSVYSQMRALHVRSHTLWNGLKVCR